MRYWTTVEVKTLSRLWGEVPASEIASRIGRTEAAVRQRAKELGLPSAKSRWTRFEDKILERWWSKWPARRIAEKVGRSEMAVRKRAALLDLPRAIEQRPKREWHYSEDQRIRELWGRQPSRLIADELDRNPAVIRQRARDLGLSRVTSHQRARLTQMGRSMEY